MEFEVTTLEVEEEEESNRKQTTIFDAINDSVENSEQEIADKKIEEMKQRMRYLKDLNQSSKDDGAMEEMENVPAYIRKGVNLEDNPHSSENDVSRTSLVEEPNKKPELRSNNSFLHDNVD